MGGNTVGGPQQNWGALPSPEISNDPRRRTGWGNPQAGISNDPMSPWGSPHAGVSNDPRIAPPNSMVLDFIRQLRGIDRVHRPSSGIGPPRRLG